MGTFDKQLAHWREQYRLAVEDLEDLFENAPCGYLSAAPDGTIGPLTEVR